MEKQGLGLAIPYKLSVAANKLGWQILTADIFLAGKTEDYDEVFLLTEMYSINTKLLLEKKVIPAICYCLESPLIAQSFYHNIKLHTQDFKYSYQFGGAEKRLKNSKTIFKNILFPVETRSPEPLVPWENRNYMVIVNSNKRALFHNSKTLKGAINTFIIEAKSTIWKMTDPLLRLRELYIDRIEAIRFFSEKPGFHLYGFGWENPINGFRVDYHRAAKKCYQGTVDDEKKRQVMGTYKFCICFENTIFPGYITEKITDCFLAGCIPIYWGAPDITNFIPAESFIDFRNFSSFADLDNFLSNLSEENANKYIYSAREFLKSENFDKFDMDMLVNEWLDVISNV